MNLSKITLRITCSAAVGALAAGCMPAVQVSSPAVAMTHKAALLTLDGSTHLQFGDEPGEPPGMYRQFGPDRPAPPPEVTVRREREAAALAESAATAFARAPGWALVRPTGASAWNELSARARPSGDAPRAIRLRGYPSLYWNPEAPSGMTGDLSPGRAQAGPCPSGAPGVPEAVVPSLGRLASELGVDAFVLIAFDVNRRGLDEHGVAYTPKDEVRAADGRLAPVARAHVLVVDRCGLVVARTHAEASSRSCGVALETENSEGEVCPIAEAASAAIAAAAARIAVAP